MVITLHTNQSVAHVLERDQAVVRALDRRRAVEVVGLPELLDFAHGLVGVAPVWVLRLES